MKQEKYAFGSQLFIPAPEYFKNVDYKIHYLGDIHGKNDDGNRNTINVIAVDANDTESIADAVTNDKIQVEKSLEDCEDSEVERNLTQQLEFLTSALEMLENSIYVKTPDEAMLQHVSNKMNKRISASDVKYTSSISAVLN